MYLRTAVRPKNYTRSFRMDDTEVLIERRREGSVDDLITNNKYCHTVLSSNEVDLLCYSA